MTIKPDRRPDLLEEFLDTEEYLDIKARLETMVMVSFYQPLRDKSFVSDKKKHPKRCMQRTVNAVEEYVDDVN